MQHERGLKTCPYDISHQIRPLQYAAHLVKCRKNNLLKEIDVCPFNSTHHIPRPEFEYHQSVCPDRRVLDLFKYTLLEKEPPPPAVACINRDVPYENTWDSEATIVETYDPSKKAASQPMLRHLAGASKSVRKAFTLEHRENYKQLLEGKQPNVETESLTKKVTVAPTVKNIDIPLRMPKWTPEEPKLGLGKSEQPSTSEDAWIPKRLVYGRGAPLSPPSDSSFTSSAVGSGIDDFSADYPEAAVDVGYFPTLPEVTHKEPEWQVVQRGTSRKNLRKKQNSPPKSNGLSPF